MEIVFCAVGAFIVAALIAVVVTRAFKRNDYRSAEDARRRIGADRAEPDPRAAILQGRIAELERTRPEWKSNMDPTPRKSHYEAPSPRPKYPGLRAVDSVRRPAPAPSPTPASDPFLDNPILNPIHPLHSAFVPSPTPSPSYDCPSPSPSSSNSDFGSSSCDSPSPSPSSDW